jgi:hypothetical protein
VQGRLHEFLLPKDQAMSHRYAVGQRVFYSQKRFPHLTWKAPYTILHCLASGGVEPQYRIRSALRGDERLAGEHELTRFSLPQQAFRPVEAPPFLDGFSPDAPANLNLVPPHLERRAWHKNEQALSAGRR